MARRHGVNQKTIAKWKKRTSTADLPTGPKDPRSTSLSIEDEAVVVTFRRHTLLPLDDCLYALQATTLYPPILPGAALPVARCRPDHRTTVAALMLNTAATDRTLSPAKTRATARSRKSIEYGLLIAANLHTGQQLESDLTPLMNPSLIHSNVIPL